MRAAALYDVRGNRPALEAVLAAVAREGDVDEIIAGGDVLWGPMQSECIDLLRDAGARFVAGNCERDVSYSTSDVDRWCAARLSERDRALVASWPRQVPGGPRLVNLGSVGLPYEGAAGAYWAIVGPEVDLRQTAYDVERAIAELRATTFPRFDEIFGASLEGRVTAAAATTELESKRGA